MRPLNLLVFLLAIVGLSACFHELEEDFSEPDIFKPDLSTEGSYDELLLKPQVAIETNEDLQALSAKIFPRLLSHLNIYNMHVDLLPSGGIGNTIPTPSFKMQKPSYHIQYGSKCEEDAEVESLQESDVQNLHDRRSSFWFDADGDTVFSPGDDWIRLLSQCLDDNTNVLSVGTVTFYDMSTHQLAIAGEDVAIEDMRVGVRLQSDYNDGVNNTTVLFNRMNATFNRAVDLSSSFVVELGSQSAATQGEDLYAFVFDSASVTYLDTETEEVGEIENVRFSGKYYDSELDGYVLIDDLKIDFLYYQDTAGYSHIRAMSLSVNPASDAALMSSTAEGLSFTIGEGDADIHDYAEVFGVQGLPVIQMD